MGPHEAAAKSKGVGQLAGSQTSGTGTSAVLLVSSSSAVVLVSSSGSGSSSGTGPQSSKEYPAEFATQAFS
jgi:hypothetical protein